MDNTDVGSKGSKLDQAVTMIDQALSLLQEFQAEENGEPADQEAQYHGGGQPGKGLAIMIGSPKEGQ